jgi:hypothetical protein
MVEHALIEQDDSLFQTCTHGNQFISNLKWQMYLALDATYAKS